VPSADPERRRRWALSGIGLVARVKRSDGTQSTATSPLNQRFSMVIRVMSQRRDSLQSCTE